MIIHEVGKYYDKESYDEFINTLHNHYKFKDLSDLKHQMSLDPSLKSKIKTDIISFISNNEIISVTTKDRNASLKLAQDLGLDKEVLTKESPKYSRQEINDIIKRNDKEEVYKAFNTSLGNYLYDNSKQNLFNARRLMNTHSRNVDGKDHRKIAVMKQWKERKRRQQEQKDTKPKNKLLSNTKKIGIGAALGTGSYLAARKLAKLKGLENKYARKLLLLPPNKRNFVQKMLDKIRALIRKYKH